MTKEFFHLHEFGLRFSRGENSRIRKSTPEEQWDSLICSLSTQEGLYREENDKEGQKFYTEILAAVEPLGSHAAVEKKFGEYVANE